MEPPDNQRIDESSVPDGMWGRLRTWPLLYKVLVGNASVVLIGAVLGTWITVWLAEREDTTRALELMLMFIVVGVLTSLVVNYCMMAAAFRPLTELERVARAVASGDHSARVAVVSSGDSQLNRVSLSFNDALEMVEADRIRIRQLADSVIAAQEGERRRIARELHDDTAQVLFAQLLRVTALSSSPHEEVRQVAASLEPMLAEAMESVRRLGHELRPPALDDLGLREAVGDLVQRMSERMGYDVSFRVVGLRERLDPAVELILYRVTQEALTNIWKHAGATAASVSIVRSHGGVMLTIDDNGQGFDKSRPGSRDERGLGLGLFGMEERVDLVGGTLLIDSNRNPGTRIRAWIPVDDRGNASVAGKENAYE